MQNPIKSFSVIRYRGDPDKAVVQTGHTVYRREKIFIQELNNNQGAWVTCASYDNHFVYEEPSGKAKLPSFICTCGSPAVVVGYSGYEGQASSQGYMLVCLLHATYGHHSNTKGENWI